MNMLCLILSAALWFQCDSFPISTSRRIYKPSIQQHVGAPSSALFMAQDRMPPDDDDDDEGFLDKQFFDPSNVKEGSPLKWFADLVEQDYETAEALFASTIITALVVVSQELLRMQINGDSYVPFKSGASSLW